jgi:uncharacterized protein YprB with RNaseH-like and TPR domain
MIRNTFTILNGIGDKLERKLWKRGILTWKDFIADDSVEFLSPARKRMMDEDLEAHQARLASGDAPWFKDALKGGEHWRLFEIFRDEAVCLDIETNGYQPEAGGYVTMVGIYDGYDYRSFVKDENLTAENLMEALRPYKYLITFYGSAFDVPFLRRALRGFDLNIPHFDLCFGARKLGMKGGLKKLEGEFGIERDEETQGMDGYDAVLLWHKVRRGSSAALELLVKYNREDTVNLWSISETIYERLKESTGIDRYANRGLTAALN